MPSSSALLREARLRAGLTQAELAMGAGVHQSSIARYESGQIEPELSTLIRLCNVAGYTLRAELQPRDYPQEALIEDFGALDAATRLKSAENFARFAAKVSRAR